MTLFLDTPHTSHNFPPNRSQYLCQNLDFSIKFPWMLCIFCYMLLPPKTPWMSVVAEIILCVNTLTFLNWYGITFCFEAKLQTLYWSRQETCLHTPMRLCRKMGIELTLEVLATSKITSQQSCYYFKEWLLSPFHDEFVNNWTCPALYLELSITSFNRTMIAQMYGWPGSKLTTVIL